MDGTVKYSLDAGSSSLAEAVPRNPLASSSIPTISSPLRVKQIWAVGGGKGGIGKSLLASSLAIALSRLGNKIIAVDLDLGGANLHTALGVDLPKQTLSDYLTQKVPALEQCISPSGIPRLEMISGAQDSINVTNLKTNRKLELLQDIRKLDADYIIFDLGAGTSFNTLDFFLYSDVRLIAMLPEPTSIENGYRFIKSAYFRYLSLCPSLDEVKALIEMSMDPKNPLGIKSPADLFREVNKAHPQYASILKQEIEKFQPYIIVNQTRTQTDVDIGASVKTVCKKYFGIDMDYIGHLDYDSSVWQSVRRKRPLMLEFPNSRIVSGIEQIVQKILKNHHFQRQDQTSESL